MLPKVCRSCKTHFKCQQQTLQRFENVGTGSLIWALHVSNNVVVVGLAAADAASLQSFHSAVLGGKAQLGCGSQHLHHTSIKEHQSVRLKMYSFHQSKTRKT
jgi:hypothetical protein